MAKLFIRETCAVELKTGLIQCVPDTLMSTKVCLCNYFTNDGNYCFCISQISLAVSSLLLMNFFIRYQYLTFVPVHQISLRLLSQEPKCHKDIYSSPSPIPIRFQFVYASSRYLTPKRIIAFSSHMPMFQWGMPMRLKTINPHTPLPRPRMHNTL